MSSSSAVPSMGGSPAPSGRGRPGVKIACASDASTISGRVGSAVRQVEGVDRAAHVAEGQLAVIRGADPDAGAIDDRLGQGAEAGAPMHATLQHHVALLHRVDAEGEQAIQIARLDMVRDDHYLDLAGIDDD